ncbi:hypothetical protein PO909_016463 [Leuciscus waleckii]
MASVEELLVNSLEDLGKGDLKKFQWHLKKDHECILKSVMEKTDVLKTVDKMVDCFGPEETVKITVKILRKMNQNNLAEQLESKHKTVSLCDIKQRPERNNSDTHTTGFSQPKPSGLDIHPLLNCQSCVHIADSDQWLQIEPSACTDEGGSKFRVSTDPGRYECVRTRMRWVCDCVVTLQYRTVDGLFLNAELERLQCNRIGPVIDVTVISGKLEEVHLPHYACLGESDPSLKDAVKVLTVKDEGITTEPVQLTRFHAKILQPSFSLKTLIISWIMRLYEHCDLLLYMRSKDPLLLHLYLFPFDDHAKEKIEKKEKSSYPVLHPWPDRPFRMKKPHMLDVPGAFTINPEEGITFRRETPPNFFSVNTSLENDLQMTLIREEDQETVWTTTIKKN